MLSGKDCKTILSRCAVLFAAVLLCAVLLSVMWNIYSSLQCAARMSAAAQAQAILQSVADTSNRAALTGCVSMMDGMYDKAEFGSMAAYCAELDRQNKLKKWSVQQSAAISGARTAVMVRLARRTDRGYTAIAEYTAVYSITTANGAGGMSALEVSYCREVELTRTDAGYIITSDEYITAPVGRIYRQIE